MKLSTRLLFSVCLLVALVLLLLFKSDVPNNLYDFAAPIVAALLTAILSPAQLTWLWKMAKWIMGRRQAGPREGVKYKYGASGGDDFLKKNIVSLSKIRRIRRPELWVVASGKGGVGKSLLSLGMAESLSQRGPVLLVDFDLHNRGLTSMLIKSTNGGVNEPTAQKAMVSDELEESAFSLWEL